MIKVRAWNRKTSSWIYWIVGEDCTCDLLVHGHIDKESLGLFTDHKDCDGKEIYENDLIELLFNWPEKNWKVEAVKGCFYLSNGDVQALFCNFMEYEMKIIGNLTETPELLDDLQGG